MTALVPPPKPDRATSPNGLYFGPVRTGLGDGDDWLSRQVILFLAERLQRDPSTISPSDRLADLSFDSLDIVELLMGLEDEFSVDIADQEFGELQTVQDLIDEIRKRRT